MPVAAARKLRIKLLLTAMLCCGLIACESISYYSQAIGGQVNILVKRRALQKIIDADDTTPALKEKLKTVLAIRDFAEDELALSLNGTFNSFADLERRYVVWNVFASSEFSMTPQTWCYPVAGCVSYRGYFSEKNAIDFANRLSSKGLDVYVGGVTAYSTLGWFEDPLLNTVIDRKDHDLASLIFHELAHQQVYVKGDTDFNESFATALEREGLRRWLDANLDSNKSVEVYEQVLLDFRRQEEFVALVKATVSKLETLYASGVRAEIMRAEKQQITAALRQGYQSLKAAWGGYDHYDNWFESSLNNAQLSTVTTYYRWVPAFEKLLESSEGNLLMFYEQVQALAELPDDDRLRALESLDPPLL